jgi:hypothetical protein
MFDFWRNLTKSKAEKERELIHAYVDDALSPAERAHFEAQLAQDPPLQGEVESLRQVKQMVATVPRRRVPRNFTLDPARYGRPAPQPLLQAQPVLRLATTLTAIIFVVVLALDWGVPLAGESQIVSYEAAMEDSAFEMEAAPAAPDTVEMEEFAVAVDGEEAEPAAESTRVSEVVTETLAEREAPEEDALDVDDEAMAGAAEDAPSLTPGIRATPAARGEAYEVETAVSDILTTITTANETEITAYPPTRPESQPYPYTNRQWLQLGLGTLLAMLLLLLLLARQQASL